MIKSLGILWLRIGVHCWMYKYIDMCKCLCIFGTHNWIDRLIYGCMKDTYEYLFLGDIYEHIHMDVCMCKCRGRIPRAKFSRSCGLQGLVADPRKEIREPWHKDAKVQVKVCIHLLISGVNWMDIWLLRDHLNIYGCMEDIYGCIDTWMLWWSEGVRTQAGSALCSWWTGAHEGSALELGPGLERGPGLEQGSALGA